MSHKCFISFKSEDIDYKEKIQNDLSIDMIDKSLNEPINSTDEDYIMQRIREEYLSDSTVTIHLIGEYSSEYYENQNFIKRELQASLYNGKNNSKSGILGVVLPSMISNIYGGSYTCTDCGNTHNKVYINDTTTIKEFSYNYYIPKTTGCGWSNEDRYCVLVKWEDFIKNPEQYIDAAFEKRTDPIAAKTKVTP